MMIMIITNDQLSNFEYDIIRVINDRLQNPWCQAAVQPPNLKSNFKLKVNQENKVLSSIYLFYLFNLSLIFIYSQ